METSKLALEEGAGYAGVVAGVAEPAAGGAGFVEPSRSVEPAGGLLIMAIWHFEVLVAAIS